MSADRLLIRCRTAEGADGAGLLVPFDGIHDDPAACYAVAVIPQLNCDQTLSLMATDGEGLVLSTAHLTVNPTDATWRSRLNYRLHRDLAYAIRDIDARTDEGDAILELTESFPTNRLEIVRGTLTVDAACSGDIAVEAIDGDGHGLDGAVTMLGNTLADDGGRPELGRRVISFTLRLPSLTPGLVVAAYDAERNPLGRFLIADDDLIRRVRDLGTVRMINASWDPLYDEWFRTHRLSERERRLQRQATLAVEPLLSIVVPLYRTPLPYLYELVESVVGQTYRSWELVLVNASPEDAELTAAVEDVAMLSDRIRVVTVAENRGISANTNEGIAAARGEYVGFLDHDDVIEPDALYEYARALNADPAIDLLYCDEDLLLEDGRLTRGYFKADFSIDLLRANNYVSHFLMVRRSLLDACGGFDPAFDGAQDHDLVLRLSERTDHIHHVKRVLYHWRVTETSTAASAEPKTYAWEAGRAAVAAHLDRLGLPARVEAGRTPFTYDVRYDVAVPHPLVSIIIPNKDQAGYLTRCIRSITSRTTYEPYEILVVENNSVEPETFAAYEALAAKDSRVRVVTYEGGFNFSKIVNFGAREARGDYFVLLNNDTELLCDDWLERLVGLCQRPDVGAVGVKLLYPDGTIQHEGVALLPIGPSHINLFLPDTDPDEGHVLYMSLNTLPQERSAVTGACMAVARRTFEAVGGFDEELAVAYNDVDFCLRLIEQRLSIVYTPAVTLHHYESVTRGYEDTPEKRLRHRRERLIFDSRWVAYGLTGDPYYNSSLLQDNQYYQLKW